jgi:GTP cyclohydrolase I
MSAAEGWIRAMIKHIGDDPDGEHCRETPKRVVKSWRELYAGYGMSPEQALGTTFLADGYDQIVVCKDIELYSTCSHHMIPFFGRAHIGYVPGKRVVGLSKLARLVEVYARRLQVQERLTDQIADAMVRILKPKGVMVVIEAKHLCMCARGIQKQNSTMVTSAIHGCFKKNGARAEFMNLIRS